MLEKVAWTSRSLGVLSAEIAEVALHLAADLIRLGCPGRAFDFWLSYSNHLGMEGQGTLQSRDR